MVVCNLMRFGRFTINVQYPHKSNVAILDAEQIPFLMRELQHFGLVNYLASSRLIILRPRFLFWLFVYGLKAPRIAANLAAYLKSSRIPILVTMDFLDIQLPTTQLRSSLLEEVSELVTTTEFVSVQHGQELRRFCLGNRPKRVTLLCFGAWVAENFPTYGRLESQYVPVGALINSLYLQARPTDIAKTHPIVVLSTVKDDDWWGTKIGERRAGFELLVSFVQRFCTKTLIKPLVALTIDRDSNKEIDESTLEREWFLQRLGESVEFTEPTSLFGTRGTVAEANNKPKSARERFATYYACDQSLLTVGMSSTALWESFARGNRILAVNLTDNPIYDFPIQGLWSMRQPTFTDFEARAQHIMQMTDDEWRDISDSAREFLVRADSTETVADRIRNHIAEVLSQHPWRK